MAKIHELYEDSYYENFTAGQYNDLCKAQVDLENTTTWEHNVSGIQVEAITGMEALTIASDPKNTIPQEVLQSTVENTRLMLKYDYKKECMRDCAFPSLLSTVGLRGAAIYRAEPENCARGLSEFLVSCRARSSIMKRAGSVAAVVSEKYAYMPIPDLLNITGDLATYLGDPEFISGCVSHSLTVAKFRYPQKAQTVTDAYRTILAAHGKTLSPNERLTPIVEFRSSDTTNEAAKLLTYLELSPGHLMPIGKGVRVNHVTPYEFDNNGNRITALDKFRSEVQLLYSMMEYDLNTLIPAMLETPIEYPGNTFVGLCVKAQIPQKWGGPIEEEIRNDWPDGSGCTFLDLYADYFTRVTKMALEENAPHGDRLLDLEEAIARIARNRAIWTKYDAPGTVAWVQTLPV